MNPLEICLFFRYRFLIQGSENVLSGVPGHLYIRIKEVSFLIAHLMSSYFSYFVLMI